ncbi:Dual oxidase 1 [Chionoecetes opilio]|uniref:Dual oxidase 1 n=1 Tax=Chionoecetes opilio TaxID=41210 RepID=A0A8J4XS62_CHIOP|nr:Dual oxidase 1 [Chionoecetes opilio]
MLSRQRQKLVRGFSFRIVGPIRERVDSDKSDGEAEKSSSEGKELSSSRWVVQMYYGWINDIRRKLQYVFWLVLYTLVMLAIFAERAYFFSVEREHRGLRRVAGYGVTVTRGAASAMMFTYSTLLVTMCRNLFALLRSTVLHRLVPFDHMVSFHRYMAFWALLWTLIHIVGHAVNFYHISTQPPTDLTCLFRDFFRRSAYRSPNIYLLQVEVPKLGNLGTSAEPSNGIFRLLERRYIKGKKSMKIT